MHKGVGVRWGSMIDFWFRVPRGVLVCRYKVHTVTRYHHVSQIKQGWVLIHSQSDNTTYYLTSMNSPETFTERQR